MLVGNGITKSFGRARVLHGVNIAVRPGEITSLIGPSGSGKTTLLRCLSMLDIPDEGEIRLDDAVFAFPASKRRLRPPWPTISVVFQQLFLWPHLTLRQNITLPAEKLRTARNSAYLDELIEMFDMGGFIDRYPNQSSLGQRQRVALARALVLNPRYVLLDEITSALDVEQVSAILSHLQLLRERGIGILIITHLLGFARRASDAVVFMDGGQIVETGGKEMIMSPTHDRIKRFISVVESAS